MPKTVNQKKAPLEKAQPKKQNYIGKIVNYGGIAAIFSLIWGIKTMKMTDPNFSAIVTTLYIMVLVDWVIPVFKKIKANWWRIIFLNCWIILGVYVLLFPIRHIWETLKTPSVQPRVADHFDGGEKKDLLIPGLLMSDQIGVSDYIYIQCGTWWEAFKVSDFINGVDFMDNVIACKIDGVVEPTISIHFRLIYNRLVISTTLKDIEHGEEVAEIKDNQISIIKPYVIDWNITPDNKAFEIIDKENDVVLKLAFANPNRIILAGYFIHNHSVSVVADDGTVECFSLGDRISKAKSLDMIEKIKRIRQF